MIILPKTVPPKTVSERLDLSFCIFARRGEKYSCYTSVLKFVSPAGRVYGAATHAVGGDAGYGLLSSLELAATLTDITVDLETRAQERPSDHAPVIAEFDC